MTFELRLYAHGIYCNLAILYFTAVVMASDQQFKCPNRGEPKVSKRTGKPIQCLPGEASEKICGKGYSCFFSGVDYQCCPSTEDEYDHVHTECPLNTLTVLNEDGAPMRCNSRTRQCPKSESQFCLEQSSAPICCERLVSDSSSKNQVGKGDASTSPPLISRRPNNHKTTTAKSLTRQELEKLTVVVNRDIVRLLACPSGSLNVVSTKGLPMRCSEDNKCPSTDMFCFRARIESVCCQEFRQNNEGNGKGNAPNGILNSEEEAKKLVEELKVQAGLPVAPSPAETHQPKPIFVADNEKKGTQSDEEEVHGPAEEKSGPKEGHIKVQINRSKAQAARTEQEAEKRPDEIDQILEYKPHNQGGYAVSRKKLERINSRKPNDANQKMLAQQFLINQIKNGWPYDERFYRAESAATASRGNHPSVIVHFPNE